MTLGAMVWNIHRHRIIEKNKCRVAVLREGPVRWMQRETVLRVKHIIVRRLTLSANIHVCV